MTELLPVDCLRRPVAAVYVGLGGGRPEASPERPAPLRPRSTLVHAAIPTSLWADRRDRSYKGRGEDGRTRPLRRCIGVGYRVPIANRAAVGSGLSIAARSIAISPRPSQWAMAALALSAATLSLKRGCLKPLARSGHLLSWPQHGTDRRCRLLPSPLVLRAQARQETREERGRWSSRP